MNAGNIIHFIYPVTDRTRPWSIVNHTTVSLARKVQNPDKIFIWVNSDDPSEELLMTSVLANAEICQIDLTTNLGGTDIVWPQYMSDVMRLQILKEHGGVYMDTDVLLLKPVHDLLTDKLVISWERDTKQSISNAFMAAPPNNPFISEWLDLMPNALKSEVWAHGGVVAPVTLSERADFEPYRTILPHNAFCPLDLSKPWLVDPSLKEAAKYLIKDSYGIHVFETFWRIELERLEKSGLETDCLLIDLEKTIRGRLA